MAGTEPTIASAELATVAAALDVLDEHADLNHRYRRLITDSRQVLADERIRVTQARGIAKKLMVLARAAGTTLPDRLGPDAAQALEAGLARADELVHG